MDPDDGVIRNERQFGKLHLIVRGDSGDWSCSATVQPGHGDMQTEASSGMRGQASDASAERFPWAVLGKLLDSALRLDCGLRPGEKRGGMAIWIHGPKAAQTSYLEADGASSVV
ncbi:hypothetical protein BN1723_003946 [Verticillium longisporum]|uniref:Uncharacterized protein n=1 Tax=Verticillium longisporum TaxID=100787 RepID=A0A0G4MGA1_VERLO|nr:hypothetical protein BN1723_003946 [Verticillium longisporum]